MKIKPHGSDFKEEYKKTHMKAYKKIIFMTFGLGLFGFLLVTGREVPEIVTHMMATIMGYLFGGISEN